MSDQDTDMPEAKAAEGADPEPFIRTYAKDFAALSGGKAATIPKREEPRTFAPKASAPQQIEEAPVPTTAPSTPPEAEREAILARLRALERPHPVETAPPVPEMGPVSAPAAALEIEAAPLIPAMPMVSKEPAPAPETDEPSPMHTYKSDFVDKTKDVSASKFSLVAAEQDARGTASAKKGSFFRSVLFALGGLVLLAGGGAIAYFAFVKSTAPNTVPIAPVAPSLVFVDERAQLSRSGANLMAALAADAAKPLPEGSVRLEYVMQSVPGPLGTTTEPAPGGVLISQLGLPAPGLLLRNIDPSSTVGAVTANGETRIFFILRAISYERTFAGMLQWEGTIMQDLAPLYPPYPASAQGVTPTSSTTPISASSTPKTATTTPPNAASSMQTPGFRDEVIGNYNVRAYKDAAGRTLLLYGYRDQSTLIIARDEAAFTTLAARLTATKTQ
ncbi:hypothetical protein KGQ55_03020 [Patescibacteria group bacterium]|nr:hypothetical protein [Patescibacteria group bacterium]